MIRLAVEQDVLQLVQLMRKLAVFEGYAQQFSITAADLQERGFSTRHSPEFIAWVAPGIDGTLQGYAVVYIIPFTFDLRPTVVLKELFVEESARGQRLGDELFAAVVAHARAITARLLRWQVLPNNEAAKRFYNQRGGQSDAAWESWSLDLDKINAIEK
ncbi:MAG: GNAT family N-acetyltransferase [Candidatus Obscuribacterales bacterium]|nr:GNAT family N-acetyltransferase [Steroidobacteraceae bacterium]